MDKNIFKNLIIYEMANNHMGDIAHGAKIIREFKNISKKYSYNFAFKLQYRNLETFIHPNYQKRYDLHYIKRFQETKLKKKDFDYLINQIKKNGFKTIATPFDEKSVDLIEKQKLDYIKIASCSFNDWPLLERVSISSQPIILSTAGIDKDDIDKVYSFLKNRKKNFCFLHCVGEYPTPDKNLELSQIDYLKNKYKDIEIGYSSHEDPQNFDNVRVAIAKGAQIFEKHVGLPTEKYALNKYSMSPSMAKEWLRSFKNTLISCGKRESRILKNKNELKSLRSLKRGVFLKKTIGANKIITKKDVYFAFPNVANQLIANEFSKYLMIKSNKKISKGMPVNKLNCKIIDNRKEVYEIIKRVKKLLKKFNYIIPNFTDYEISHHYGLNKFSKIGLTMFNIINREYCKKILVLLPGQKHPTQFHKIKEETFNLLHGDLKLSLNGKIIICNPGDVITIKPGDHHEFSSKYGCIVEEISTTHYKNDSFYIDKKIMKNQSRKTHLSFWLN